MNHRLLRDAILVASLVLVAALMAGCSGSGLVTGGTLQVCGSLNKEESSWIDVALQLVVCPKLKDHFKDRPCSFAALRELLHEVTLYFYAAGDDYCVNFDKPDD